MVVKMGWRPVPSCRRGCARAGDLCPLRRSRWCRRCHRRIRSVVQVIAATIPRIVARLSRSAGRSNVFPRASSHAGRRRHHVRWGRCGLGVLPEPAPRGRSERSGSLQNADRRPRIVASPAMLAPRTPAHLPSVGGADWPHSVDRGEDSGSCPLITDARSIMQGASRLTGRSDGDSRRDDGIGTARQPFVNRQGGYPKEGSSAIIATPAEAGPTGRPDCYRCLALALVALLALPPMRRARGRTPSRH